MTIALALSVVVLLFGLLLYLLPTSPKLNEIGRICFFCGLLAALLLLHGGLTLTLFR